MAKDENVQDNKTEKPKSVEDLHNKTKAVLEEKQKEAAQQNEEEGTAVTDKVDEGAKLREEAATARAEAQRDARTGISDSQVAGITTTVDEAGRTAAEQAAAEGGDDFPVDDQQGSVASVWARAEDGQLSQVRQLDTRG